MIRDKESLAGKDSAVIILADQPITVSPLTLRMLREVLPILMEAVEWANLRVSDFAAFVRTSDRGLILAAQIIAAATGKTQEEVLDIPATLVEAALAIYTIGDLSGVLSRQETASGEAPAGTSTGE